MACPEPNTENVNGVATPTIHRKRHPETSLDHAQTVRCHTSKLCGPDVADPERAKSKKQNTTHVLDEHSQKTVRPSEYLIQLS